MTVDVMKGHKKDIHDVGPSPIVAISSGANPDARLFYSTTHSTTYRALTSSVLRGPINGVHSSSLKPVSASPTKFPSLNFKRGSGYTRNLVPHIDYDRNVDESDAFRIQEPYRTVTVDHYKAPPKPNLKDQSGLSTLVESGFTRLPKFKVTEDGTVLKDKKSQMKASYNETGLRFKDAYADKSRILPSETAYTEDCGQIQSLGNLTVFTEADRFKPKTPPSTYSATVKPNLNTNPTAEDGFSRSGVPLSRRLGCNGSNSHEKQMKGTQLEVLKHKDLAEWVQKVDPTAKQSLSRAVHVPLDALHTLTAAQNGEKQRIGWKEPTGAVHNNPKFIPLVDPSPAERFSTETIRRFQPPKDLLTLRKFQVDHISKSGFADGNRFTYTNSAKSDRAILESMHPSVAKYHWKAEKGLYTRRPPQGPHIAFTMQM
ncbi:hypothetical protein HDV05_004809 [Chytridiales sp. JEL 0842]|nr:hypothetical protein HDV05_004809 [Chytridiales sp. JEL 0842]